MSLKKDLRSIKTFLQENWTYPWCVAACQGPRLEVQNTQFLLCDDFLCHKGSQMSSWYVLCISFMGAHLFIYFYILFLQFWLCWVFTAACRLPLVRSSRGHSLAAARRLLIAVASRCRAQGLQWLWHRLRSCGAWLRRYPVACGIFPDQGSNLYPFIGRLILSPWTTREIHMGTHSVCAI